MYQYKNLDDTIAAISTAAGAAGIGVVRLSGREAVVIAGRVFAAKNNIPLSQQPSHTVHYGHIVIRDADGGSEVVDEVLATVMRAPRTYTREDVVEISCHGGFLAQKSVLAAILDAGARQAEPGEFTKRAFLNGRIDLTQAEAVLDIIQARSDAFLKVSTHQLKGELAVELEAIREVLMNIYTELEANVNFPEDDIDDSGRARVLETIRGVKARVGALLRSGEQGRILKEGIKIVLCGKANAGKSSLLNVLLRQPRAIVSHIEGTTRDTIEESAEIRGVALQLVDTAGILEPRDLIEEEAVKRSHMYIQGADLVLFVVDGSRPLSSDDEKIIGTVEGRDSVMIVLNKCDLDEAVDVKQVMERFPGAEVIRVSALEKQGVDELESAIVSKAFHGRTVDTNSALLTNLRHIQSMKACHDKISRSEELAAGGTSYEFISEEIKGAVNDLDAITGRNIDADLIDKIFTGFCIGK